eukprot:2862015-Rhodomonas_salina.2
MDSNPKAAPSLRNVGAAQRNLAGSFSWTEKPSLQRCWREAVDRRVGPRSASMVIAILCPSGPLNKHAPKESADGHTKENSRNASSRRVL